MSEQNKDNINTEINGITNTEKTVIANSEAAVDPIDQVVQADMDISDNEIGIRKVEDIASYAEEAAKNLNKLADEEEKSELESYADEAAKNLIKLADEEEKSELKSYVEEAAKNLNKLADEEEKSELKAHAEEVAKNLNKLASEEEKSELKVHAEEAAGNVIKPMDKKEKNKSFCYTDEAAKNPEKPVDKVEKSIRKQPADDMESEYDEPEKKSHKALWIVLAVIIGLLILAYVGGVIFFSQHFGAYSTVNDVDCSFMTVSEVENIISEQVKEYNLTILERKDASETINGIDVGLEYVPDGQVKQLILDQNAMIWPYRFFAKELAKQNTYTSVKLDEDKFIAVLDGLNCLDDSKMIAPVDSYPYLDGNIYIAYPQEEGTTISDKKAVSLAIKEAILGTIPEIDLTKGDYYTNPVLTTESPEVTDIVDKYNEYIGLTITYHFGDTTEVLDGATTNSWFTWDENMVPTLNKDLVKAWTKEFGLKHDTVGKERTFKNPQGVEITVKGGLYGWSVDEKAEYNMILQMYEEKQSQDRDPIWEQTAASFGEQDFGNTYIEVNLSTQHMIFWKEGEIIFEDDVITGLPTSERETPQGTWFILEKKLDKIMRGDQHEDGSYEYETPCDYWMRVTWTGVGFHDATWQYQFGGNVYTYNGSHGCINMKYTSAQTLYGLCEVGTPVIIYKTQP